MFGPAGTPPVRGMLSKLPGPQARNKGRISRYLANKCSIASRIDCFSDISTTAFGQKLKEQACRWWLPPWHWCAVA